MGLSQRIRNALATADSSTPTMSELPERKNQTVVSNELELVAPEGDDSYQNWRQKLHCEEHFLFTMDCAACQEQRRGQKKSTPDTSRSFGFTDTLTTAVLNSAGNGIQLNAKDEALQTLPQMMLKARAPDLSMGSVIILNDAIESIVELEIDLLND